MNQNLYIILVSGLSGESCPQGSFPREVAVERFRVKTFEGKLPRFFPSEFSVIQEVRFGKNCYHNWNHGRHRFYRSSCSLGPWHPCQVDLGFPHAGKRWSEPAASLKFSKQGENEWWLAFIADCFLNFLKQVPRCWSLIDHGDSFFICLTMVFCEGFFEGVWLTPSPQCD